MLAKEMARRIAGMIRPLGANTAIPVPRSDWTVGEHAAHLAYAKDFMARCLAGESLRHGDGTREGLAAANLELLIGYTERNGAILADRLESAVDTFYRRASSMPPHATATSPVGMLPVDTYASYVLTHLMMHGEAMAQGLRRPSILDRQSIVAALPFVCFAIEKFVDHDAVRGFTAAYAVHMRGGPTFYVTFDNGEVRVTSTKVRRVDCHISADPVALFRVGVRLTQQWGPIAQLKLTTWGPKPWLAFKFAGTFLPP